jgi:hypothetical protein
MPIRREDYTNRLDYLDACRQAGETPETPSSFLTLSAGSPPEPVSRAVVSVSPIPDSGETRFGYRLTEIMAQLQAHTDGGDTWFADQGEDALRRKGFVDKLMTTAPRPPKGKKQGGKLGYVPGSYLVGIRNVCCEPDCRAEFIPVAAKFYRATNRCEACLAKFRTP